MAFWGFLGGIPFCNALKVNALRAQKPLYVLYVFIKTYIGGYLLTQTPIYFYVFLFLYGEKQGLRRSAYSLRQ